MKCVAADFLSANTGKNGKKKRRRRREEAGFSRTLLLLPAAAPVSRETLVESITEKLDMFSFSL